MEDWISIANLAKVTDGISNVRWIDDCFFNSTVTDNQAVKCHLILKIKLIFFYRKSWQNITQFTNEYCYIG